MIIIGSKATAAHSTHSTITAAFSAGGLYVGGTHNLVFRNSASGNGAGDYAITGFNNVVGDIIDTTAGGTVTSSEAGPKFRYLLAQSPFCAGTRCAAAMPVSV